MTTKDIEIEYSEGEGKDKVEIKGTVTMKRLNFSEKNLLDEEIVEIRFAGSIPQTRISTQKMKELGIAKSIVSSDLFKTTYTEFRNSEGVVELRPVTMGYPLTGNGIRELPIEVGEGLFTAFQELNSVSEKKGTG